MKDFYDFSKGRRNPYAEKLKKEGYSITINYSPEDIIEMLNNVGKRDLDSDEFKAFEKYRRLNQP